MMTFSLRSIGTILIVLTSMNALVAKSRPPMTFQLEKTSSEPSGEQELYHVQLSFSPTAESERIVLKVNLPQDYKLVEGFAYWEGQLEKDQRFEKTLKVEGPKNQPKNLSVDAKMFLGGSTTMARTLLLKLEPDTEKVVSAFPPLAEGKFKASGPTPIRRE